MKGLDFSYEQPYWNKQKNLIVGIDEVGRGPLAGPVVVGAVIISPKMTIIPGVRDSKKVPKSKHSEISKLIKENCVSWAIGVGSVEQINSFGIVGAIRFAIHQALEEIKVFDQVLMDGSPFKEPLNISEEIDFITKGDSKVYSIAAASIIAKDHRDNLMREIGLEFPQFGWENNSGYGTKVHTEAILEHGVNKHHRDLFVRKFV
ncbi:MAG: ribonuclease HII [Candidatus Pacebacteria bacterium]|nr:ribonuclease HII [Candidatus Paceibacterota bacterium]